jgi:diguanylate cyclase (GGDEF)-like protein
VEAHFTPLGDTHPYVLIATSSMHLVDTVEASLLDSKMQVRSATSTAEAIEAMRGRRVPSAALLDVELPGGNLEQVLAALNGGAGPRGFPIVLMCDEEIPAWSNRLAEGVIDDLIPRTMPPIHWRVRLEVVLRAFRHMRELQQLNEATATVNREVDLITGLYRREALLSILFRETDRVQRMNTSLCIMVLEIDDFAHWRERVGTSACDDLLKQVVARVHRLLRTYDVLGRTGPARFALCLPGCATVNAVSLAERIRMEVHRGPFQAGQSAVRLTVSCGIAPSHGRSPLVVLRDAEEALKAAKAAGPESICSSRDPKPLPLPADFLSPVGTKDRADKPDLELKSGVLVERGVPRPMAE